VGVYHTKEGEVMRGVQVLMAVTRGVMAVTRAKCELAIMTSLKVGAHNLLTEDSSQTSHRESLKGASDSLPKAIYLSSHQ
jgi:hypothetical protein